MLAEIQQNNLKGLGPYGLWGLIWFVSEANILIACTIIGKITPSNLF